MNEKHIPPIAIACVTALLVPACNSPSDLPSRLQVIVSLSTQVIDPDGFELELNGTVRAVIPGEGGYYENMNITPGTHTLRLRGLSPGCQILNGNAARTIKTRGGGAYNEIYHVGCSE